MNFFRKKYYREVPCKACDGNGKYKREQNCIHDLYCNFCGMKQKVECVNSYQNTCQACNGKGTQTVLGRIE